ncbi:Hypothetical predicted protein [Marmota monax]|uniref:Uncharacterized protein n=1 Tax=Marmota monax TaxID=9995 RepID=A0A5E4D0L1_MARMO|nr:hypothetical protein GHT09_008080 [Marmota monax]VTJ87596.1 Hypothetical predicted protein [Marmota monax]
MDAYQKGNQGRVGHPEVHESVENTALSSTSVTGGLGERVLLFVPPWRDCLVFRGLMKYIFAQTQPLPYLEGSGVLASLRVHFRELLPLSSEEEDSLPLG